jgi:beta-glucosidase
MSTMEKPWIASCRQVDHSWMSLKDYRDRCQSLLSLPRRTEARLVFMGDSITEGWCTEGVEVWREIFESKGGICLGIGGDQTQNLLWRIEQGEVGGLKPHVVVLLIGINNLWWGGFTPEETHRGITAVVESLASKLPDAKILLHGILPASRSLQDDLRQRIIGCNRLTQSWYESLQSAEDSPLKKAVHWADLTSIFLGPQGHLDPALCPDFVHLSPLGYRAWALALQKVIGKLIGEPLAPANEVCG